MKNTIFAALLCIAFSAFSSGCSSSASQTTNPPPVITVSVAPLAAALAPGNTTQFTATITGDTSVTWSVNGTAGGDATVGTIDSTGLYTAPSAAQSATVTISAASVMDPTKSSSATAYVVATGIVTPTQHPLVALYSIDPPSDATVSIAFGPDTNYGQTTSVQPTPAGGGVVGIQVAGMRASSTYHMRATVNFTDGTVFADADQTFDTGPLAPLNFSTITATTTAGMTPQPGIEMLDLVPGSEVPVVATDLAGNIIWWYNFTDGTGSDIVQPIRMLPNGHFLVCIGPTSSAPISMTPPLPNTITVVREIDLAGNTVREISLADLNSRLAAANFTLVADTIHHDVLQLPNGHWIILTSATRDFTDLTGLPGVTTVLGDQIIDLDANLNPVWVWDGFDHLDVNRHPFAFPDWTHANALLFTDDGNLLVSLRHQNWVIKIDYANGTGTGDVIWRLGFQGDFTLSGGTSPQDWFYAQHNPSFFTQNSSVDFELGLMDNGDDRIYPSGQTCASTGGPLCPNYTTIPIFHIDESAMTATLAFQDKLANYSFFGGSMNPLDNGNVEYDLCALPGATRNAGIFEVTRDANPQTVWQMTIVDQNAYRGYRLPSLYPQSQ